MNTTNEPCYRETVWANGCLQPFFSKSVDGQLTSKEYTLARKAVVAGSVYSTTNVIQACNSAVKLDSVTGMYYLLPLPSDVHHESMKALAMYLIRNGEDYKQDEDNDQEYIHVEVHENAVANLLSEVMSRYFVAVVAFTRTVIANQTFYRVTFKNN